MTRAEEAAACLRRWWEIRQPAELAELGLTTHAGWLRGRWQVSFGWRDYLNERQQGIAQARDWPEAIEIAAALLTEIHALRTRAQMPVQQACFSTKKPSGKEESKNANTRTSAA